MSQRGATLQGPNPSMKPWASTRTNFSTASGYSSAKSMAMAPPKLVPTSTIGLLIYTADTLWAVKHRYLHFICVHLHSFGMSVDCVMAG